MSGVVVVLSGPVSSGKTTLARRLAERFGARHLKTSTLLEAISEGKVKRERWAMQKLGSRLDRETDGAWIAEGFAQGIEEMPSDAVIVIDAVRTLEQIEGLRSGLSRAVVHVHLTAPLAALERRYARRPKSRFAERASYAEVLKDRTEKRVPLLADDADVVIDTGRSTRPDVAVRAASYLGLNARDPGALVDVIVGGQYGSEGKGNIAFAIGPEYDLLCRVGGPNAGHKVPLDMTLTHRLLPSATRSGEAPIVIGPGAVLDIDVLFNEIAESEVEYGRLHIDPQAMIINASDIEAEGGLMNTIGSTGKGVGVATARRITERDKPAELARDVKALEPFIAPTGEILADAYSRGSRILLEGTQGSGLSLYHGHYPHVTSRDTTAAGCLAEMGISPSRVRRVIMVCRTYPIRVQSPSGKGKTSGPMSQPTNWTEISRRSGIALKEFRRVEKGSVSKKKRRVGEFDWDLLRRSAELNGATDIALTFVDYLDVKNRDARRFDQLQPETIRFIEEVERVSGAPVSLISTRFHLRSVIDRRAW
ncbi:MAG: adenylosuccinate synthetase [Actinobacteria bacterium]|nr:adenylosuccinate synthetase [Actinomycetota bacterium]